MMRTSPIASFFGVCLAAASSIATSQAPPDWTLKEEVEGDITMSPEVEEVVVKLRVTSEVVGADVDFAVKLDPAPPSAGADEDTPILFFVGAPTEVGAAESDHHDAMPSGSRDDRGFDRGTISVIPPETGARDFTVRISWNTPNPKDKEIASAKKNSDGDWVGYTAERPVAPRKLTKIHWRATIQSAGYDDRPAGAKVDIEAAP